jgi:glutathione synthase/RimK-type ligase-like ATP-grasp enzyme
MILFCGISSEPPLRLAITAAEEAGIAHLLFNQRHALFSDISFDISEGRVSGILRYRESEYALEDFSGVFTRLTDWRTLPENRPAHGVPADSERVYRSRILHEALGEWIELADCRVLNRARAMASNASKPYQAQLIALSGLLIASTLVTNDPAEVRAFAREHGRIIYKSISSARSIVRELGPTDLKHLEKVRHLPTQFQAFVHGTNVRVHVVGEEVFATRVETDSVDYRYAAREDLEVNMSPTELPSEIRLACVGLSKSLDLPLCGIDLKVTPSGEWYCFEVNPSPAYSYYEQETGQSISRAVAFYLAGGR